MKDIKDMIKILESLIFSLCENIKIVIILYKYKTFIFI
jgi:hypothetical protein